MCLILFAHQAHPEYALALAANRDEFHARPTAPLAEWEDSPGVFGGRDLKSGGTWLAVTREGRWAAVTNFRDPAEIDRAGPSRGHLVGDYVRGEHPPQKYLEELESSASEYNGYNLLLGTHEEVWWSSNRASTAPRKLEPGLYGVSNHLLDTPWPKVVRGKELLRTTLNQPQPPGPTTLLDLLLDRAYAADHELPATGVAPELERALSASFISLPDYGTRSSTALLIEKSGPISIAERRFGADSNPLGEIIFTL